MSIEVRCQVLADCVVQWNRPHATLVFERICAAPVERVFTAFANPAERASWGASSETAAFVYDQVDFREGGIDVFRCGDKSNPQYRGVTKYYDIVPKQRIVSSEIVETQGTKLLITMSTTTFELEGAGTKVIVTAQLTSLAGDKMLNCAKFGHNASLDNLVEAMR
jgi:uncharacterized protein YndB with AHSA1/START domain